MVNVLMGFVFVIQDGLELRIDLCTQTSKCFSKNIIITRDRSFVKFSGHNFPSNSYTTFKVRQ